uniref:Uncharacterized protein n=1 Tax=Rhizophora mucronata TaxID=61149 RepID=A0A2P2R3E1_RHIMU
MWIYILIHELFPKYVFHNMLCSTT